MVDPFLAVGSIGVKPHVCQFAIVLELAYKHVSEVGALYIFLKYGGQLGCRCSLQALAGQIMQSLRMICSCRI
eukprot:3327405-Ditylum_brightwellii.AAC.1